MVNSKLLQIAYNHLYIQIRKYIWPFYIVEILANLEMAIYQAVPDITKVKVLFSQLKDQLRVVMKDDVDLRIAVNSLEKSLVDQSSAFTKITQIREVVSL